MIRILFFLCFFSFLWGDHSDVRKLFQEQFQIDADSIECMNFGLTNRNFRVTANNQTYFIRMGTSFPSLLCIVRENEEKFYQIAEDLELAPKLLYCELEQGIMVTPYVHGTKFGKIMGKWTGNPKDVIACIIQTMKKIHSVKSPINHPIPYPYRIMKCYFQVGLDIGAAFPPSMEEAVALIQAVNIPFGKEVLCHHDFFWTNLLHDGKKLWIVDWEYADWDDPFYDLAGFCIKQDLNEEEKEFALQGYLSEIRPEDRDKFDKMCMLFALNTAMWGFIQNKIQPDLKIDILSIAQKHLKTFFKLYEKIVSQKDFNLLTQDPS